MRVSISSRIYIDDPVPEIERYCSEHLTVKNPEYAKKQRMGFWVGNTPEHLRLYERNGNGIILPYGCWPIVKDYHPEYKFQQHERLDFQCHIDLYDYQEAAVRGVIGHPCGILQAPPGSGKTVSGIALAARAGYKTLWLTHTQDLLAQSKNTALRYMPEEYVGTITAGEVNIGSHITFATVQTMCHLDLGLYKNEWDTIIVDEAHRVAGSPTQLTMFSKVLNALAARRKYGLSATVHRADGMIAATFAVLGPVIYVVPKEAVADKIMPVSIYPRRLDVYIGQECLDTDGTIIHAKLINYLAEHYERNKEILRDLVNNGDHYNIILSDRLGHLEHLMNSLPTPLREQAVMVSGKMTSKKGREDREQAMQDMRAGKKRYLFATYALCKEGLDIPRLDRMYLCTPQKDFAVITQSIGRVARTFPGKGEPIVYDYIDENIKYAVNAYKTRCRHYRKAGCSIYERTPI